MSDLQKGVTFVDGVSSANAANLNNLVDLGTILPAFISAKTNLASPSTGCELVVNDAGTLKKVTIANLATAIMGGFTGQVHGKTAITSLSDLDEFLVWEDTAADERKITYNDLVTELQGDLGLPTILTGTLTHDPGSISPANTGTYTMTVTGASPTNNPVVVIGTNLDLDNINLQITHARVSAANTVRWGYYNFSTSSSSNPPSHTVRAIVFQY
jgi:hypothetical protein